jgi:hypothetical protein
VGTTAAPTKEKKAGGQSNPKAYREYADLFCN